MTAELSARTGTVDNGAPAGASPVRRSRWLPVLRRIAGRVLMLPVALFVVCSLCFVLVDVPKTNPAAVISGSLATEEQQRALNEKLGVTQPLWHRYVTYLDKLLHGDLGSSFYTSRRVSDSIAQTLPNTLELVIPALIVAIAIGALFGSIGAYYRGQPADRVSRIVVTVTQSIPDFLWGLLLIYVVFFKLGWAPAPTGQIGLFDTAPPAHTHVLIIDTIIAGDWGLVGTEVDHLVLPVLALGLFLSAAFAKSTRAVLSRALGSSQVEFARACGLHEHRVLGYAFRESRSTLVTYAAILFATSIGGAAIVETVFGWGGFGQWGVTAMVKLDLPEIQGFVLVTGVATLVTYLLLDIALAFMDPRVRL